MERCSIECVPSLCCFVTAQPPRVCKAFSIRYLVIPLFFSDNLFTHSYTASTIFKHTNIISAIQLKRHQTKIYLVTTMAHSTAQCSTSSASIPSIHVHAAEDTTPGRYTCYDTGIFLALIIVLATTSTVDVASEAFEQSENVSQAHEKIQITDAHVELARRPSLKERRGAGREQVDGNMKAWMGFRVGVLMKKVVRNLKGEQRRALLGSI